MVLLQILLLALQIKRDSEGRLIRVWTVGRFSPFERAGNHGIGHLRETWRHYFALQNASRENEQLRRENDELKMQVNQLQSKASEADRLALLLNFRKSHENVPMLGSARNRYQRRNRQRHDRARPRLKGSHQEKYGRYHPRRRGR